MPLDNSDQASAQAEPSAQVEPSAQIEPLAQSKSMEQKDCFHCGESIPSGLDLTVQFQQQDQSVCCVGCQQIAETIIDNGMAHYYQYRTEYAEPPTVELTNLDTNLLQQIASYDLEEVQTEFVTKISDDRVEAKLSIQGISCAACVWLIEKYLRKQNGVIEASVNLTQHTATLAWNPTKIPLSELIKVIYQIGYQAFPFDPSKVEDHLKLESQKALRRILIAGLGTMQAMMFAVPLYVGEWTYIATEHQFAFRLASLIMTLPVVFYSASPFFKAAKRDLKTRHLTMDVPVSLAIGFAFLASVWITFFGGKEVYFDSVCMFTFFLSIGRYLEMKARHKAGMENNRLSNAFPSTATVLTPFSKQTETSEKTNTDQQDNLQTIFQWNQAIIPAKLVETNQMLLIKAGEQVPVDGEIVAGQSHFDESVITGEFKPIERNSGQTLLAGSTNIDQPVVIRAQATSSESKISSIQRLLEQAQSDRPQIAELADKVAQYFVAAVLIVATLVTTYWLNEEPSLALSVLLSVLVVTCPCALSLATPTALTVASNRLMEQGVLLTHGTALETLVKSDWILFDKTGTLTEGKFTIVESWYQNPQDAENLFRIAATMEAQSEHPIAAAFRTKLASNLPVQTKTIPGQGIEAILDKDTYRIGKLSFCSEQFSTGAQVPFSNLKKANSTHVFMSKNGEVVAEFGLQDAIKPGVKELLNALSARYKLGLLTGDGSEQAKTFASQFPFDLVAINQTPEQKLEKLTELQNQGLTVSMVGDGINDLPVIGKAHGSIAMGSGADLAKQSADIVILQSRTKSLASLFRTSRVTLSVIKQNILWALMYNATTLPLAAMGWIPPWMAAIGMSFSSLLVVLNALRLKSS